MKYVANSLVAILVVSSLISARTVDAQEFLIQSFSGSNGWYPAAGLVMDAKGDLFGTTFVGGAYDCGIAFEFIPVAGGGWGEKVIHDFTPAEGKPDSPFVLDAKGNLYSTTYNGGDFYNGMVFELSPATDGSWIETTLYSFGSYLTDGIFPHGVTFDRQGNLYGTTSVGGANREDPVFTGLGTVFALTPTPGGTWMESVLYSFGATRTDGNYPNGGLVIDSTGNLYGTTNSGGVNGVGRAFELIQLEDKSWAENVLHDFIDADPNGVFADGLYPAAGLLLNNGNLYGTTSAGGSGNFGTVFELSPAGGGAWTEKFLSLYMNSASGIYPTGDVTIDGEGNLYGTTGYGGAYDATSSLSLTSGTVFKITPQPQGNWTETILHSFPANAYDGVYPNGGVILDSKGNLYGTTSGGGGTGRGTVFGIAAGTPAYTRTTIVVNPSTNLVAGEPITLTATVTPASGSTLPTGIVIFADPAVPNQVSVVPLKAGVAVFNGKVPPAGTYSLFANYSGGAGFDPSYSSTITKTVTAPPPQ